MSAAQPPGRMLRRPEVERETGLKRSTIYELMAKGSFPKQVRIARRAVAWPSAEIERWKREQLTG